MTAETLTQVASRLLALDQKLGRDAQHRQSEIRTVLAAVERALTEKAPIDEPHIPYRGSDVEVWIKKFRDGYPRHATAWYALDDMLDEYRLRADVGRDLMGPPPSEHPET